MLTLSADKFKNEANDKKTVQIGFFYKCLHPLHYTPVGKKDIKITIFYFLSN